MLWFLSTLQVLFGCCWGGLSLLQGRHLHASLDFGTAALGLLTMVLTRRGRLRAASLLLLASLVGLLCASALLFDVPNAAAPRSIHQFLVPLGVCASLLLQGERAWLRHGVPVLCLTAFVVFTASPVVLTSAHALPDAVRVPGTWINSALAMLALYGVLRVMQTDVAERHALEADLRQALGAGQFELHYQPQVAADGRVLGAEALLRWRHPVNGMVSPGEFIPLAERSGLILPIGDWVLEQACARLAAWQAAPQMAGLRLAVNVSAYQFREADFVARVMAVVRRHDPPPDHLKLELTESMLVRDLDDIVAKMSALKAQGVGFSLDDFGTGFSSLSYLKRLPLDQLKIDQSFVRDVLTDPNDAAIARTVISLGQTLGLDVIAEGVETEGQRQFLSDNGCHAFQGYLFSRPLPQTAFEAFVAGTPTTAGSSLLR